MSRQHPSRWRDDIHHIGEYLEGAPIFPASLCLGVDPVKVKALPGSAATGIHAPRAISL